MDNLILIRGSKGRSGLYLYNKTDNIDEVLLYAGRDGDKILQSPDRTVIDIYNDSIELSGSVKFQFKRYFSRIQNYLTYYLM